MPVIEEDSFSSLKSFQCTSSETRTKLTTSVTGKKMEEVFTALSDGMLAAINAQLKDVIEKPSTVDKAPLTNLLCERNFGYLDEGMRKRPNCSLHFMSSVILLRQTRKRLRQWLMEEMSDEERNCLMKRARVEGKEMRRKHQARDKKAVTESLKVKLKESPVTHHAPQEKLAQGQMIAVACQDDWYTGKSFYYSFFIFFIKIKA